MDAALLVLQGLARCADAAFRARLVFGESLAHSHDRFTSTGASLRVGAP